jgi:putative transposase
VVEHRVSLLSYNITCNHVHLVVFSDYVEQIARFMQRAAGAFAQDYNRRKNRSGAFWEGRYHATIVDSGSYFWECLKYVELNMVRCGAVKHPREWEWSGYQELMGQRRRHRLLDVSKLLYLLRGPSLDDFRKHFEHALAESIAKNQVKRQEQWTQSLAVGSQKFVQSLQPQVRNRRVTECCEQEGAWVLKEA